jgi:hypothetical protein
LADVDFNQGQAHVLLGDPAKALLAFDQALAETWGMMQAIN